MMAVNTLTRLYCSSLIAGPTALLSVSKFTWLLLSVSCGSLQTVRTVRNTRFLIQHNSSLTQLQQLRRDSFTDTRPSTRHYCNFMVEQARSENTGRRHTCLLTPVRREDHDTAPPAGRFTAEGVFALIICAALLRKVFKNTYSRMKFLIRCFV